MKPRKLLSILLVLVLSIGCMSLSALADWKVFGGGNAHNAVVSDAPLSGNPTVAKLKLLNGGGGWDGVDTAPVMETVGNTTYAYILYDAHGGGSHLAKINCNSALDNYTQHP